MMCEKIEEYDLYDFISDIRNTFNYYLSERLTNIYTYKDTINSIFYKKDYSEILKCPINTTKSHIITLTVENKSELKSCDFLSKFFNIVYKNVFIPEIYKIFIKHNFFQIFYNKYIKDSIKLANSNNFMNHTSVDSVILSLESALFNFFDSNYYIEIKDEVFREFKKALKKYKINLIYNKFEENKNKSLINCYSIFLLYKVRLSDIIGHFDTNNTPFDNFIYYEVYNNACFNDIIYGFISNFSNENNYKTIKDDELIKLSSDINLFFTRNISILISNFNILTIVKNKLEYLINYLKTNLYDNTNETSKQIVREFLEIHLLTLMDYCFATQETNKEYYYKMLQVCKVLREKLLPSLLGTEIPEMIYSISIETLKDLKSFVDECYNTTSTIIKNKINFNLYDFVKDSIDTRVKHYKGNSFLCSSFISQCKLEKL